VVCPGGLQPVVDLEDARPDLSEAVVEGAAGDRPAAMEFTGHGNKVFHQITREEAIRGLTLGTPRHFAIVHDNQLRSWPEIEYQTYPDGIDRSNGGAEITGPRHCRMQSTLQTFCKQPFSLDVYRRVRKSRQLRI